MTDTYTLQDWSALCLVKNFVTPKRKAIASVCPCTKSTVITIYEDNTILVRIAVESKDVWSMTDDEAIELLSTYGFNCRYENYYTPSKKVIEILKSLKDLGYTRILRDVKVGKVFVQRDGQSKPDSLEEMLKDTFDYSDWKFLKHMIIYSVGKLIIDNKCNCCE